jgi:FKBP-type peptidyl-prolyl cis-trans isomerase FkpA
MIRPVRPLALATLFCSALALPAAAAPGAAAQRPKGEDEETLYALGALLGRRLSTFHLGDKELELIKKGLVDAAKGKKLALDEDDLEEWGPKVDAAMARRANPAIEEEKRRGAAFAEAAAKEPGAIKRPSGVVLRTLKSGEGPSPSATDKVKVHYEGKLLDGTVFDSSRKRGAPAEFRLKDVIPCWTEGVPLMKVGETARLICPAATAYGPQGRPPKIPGGASLVFEIELLELVK